MTSLSRNMEVMIGYNWSGQQYGPKRNHYFAAQREVRFITACKIVSYVPVIGALALIALRMTLKGQMCV